MHLPARLAAALLALAGCAGPRPPAPAPPLVPPREPLWIPPIPGLPPVPQVDGPLDLRVVYPPAGTAVDVGDSTFLFGSTGTGGATLQVNGAPVRVWPNGTWLAWVAAPADSLMTFRVQAATARDTAEMLHPVRRVRRFRPPATGLWVDTTSFSPAGRVWWPSGEVLAISVRAAEGASLQLLLPDGRRVSLAAVPSLPEVAEAIRAFDRDSANLVRSARSDRYRGTLTGPGFGDFLGPVLGGTVARTNGPAGVLEVARNGDTLRVRWPLRLTRLEGEALAELDDDPKRKGGTDGITMGRALPAGTYHWFLPAGTRAAVTGRVNDDVRIRLSATSDAWVAAAELQLLADRVATGRATVGSITTTVRDGRPLVRIPVAWRVPHQVDQTDRGLRVMLYGTAGDVNWIRYGPTVPGLDRISWRQATADQVEIAMELTGPLWGYRVRWDRNDLMVELRPRPMIDPASPLNGRRIVVDAGHPPAGATGPSGMPEAEANLGVARIVRDLLEAEGATVIMTRDDDRPVDLWPRVRLADSLDAELEVSIHNNALPDGVNPFRNSGSSVFYFHPGSIPLARAVQRELVARLGLRDLGFGRGDLALVRGTWMPSILTEGLFMMIPEQEAALRSETGRRLYAEAVVAGIRNFLAGPRL